MEITPTLFCRVDCVGDLDKELFILLGVLATNENLNRKSAALELLKVLGLFGGGHDVETVERKEHESGREFVT